MISLKNGLKPQCEGGWDCGDIFAGSFDLAIIGALQWMAFEVLVISSKIRHEAIYDVAVCVSYPPLNFVSSIRG